MKVIFASTDFSDAGNNAVKYAIRYASIIKSSLVIFHAVQAPRIPATMTANSYRVLEKNTVKLTQRMLDLVVDKLYSELKLKRQDKKVKTIVKNGIFVIDTLLSAAREHKAEMIVLGTHGATGLKILGSITSEIIFNAATPVLAVPPDYRPANIKTMVYASDVLNLDQELKRIVPVASALKANLEVLHLASDSKQKDTSKLIKTSLKKFRYQKIKPKVITYQPPETLISKLQQYLYKTKPHMLIMFPAERSFFDKLFVKSKTERLTYVSKLPLLTIRKSIV